MKILFGVVQPTGGSIEIDGLGKTVISNPRHALSLGIGLVSHELSLVPQLEVAQNVFLGQERLPASSTAGGFALLRHGSSGRLGRASMSRRPF